MPPEWALPPSVSGAAQACHLFDVWLQLPLPPNVITMLEMQEGLLQVNQLHHYLKRAETWWLSQQIVQAQQVLKHQGGTESKLQLLQLECMVEELSAKLVSFPTKPHAENPNCREGDQEGKSMQARGLGVSSGSVPHNKLFQQGYMFQMWHPSPRANKSNYPSVSAPGSHPHFRD